MRISDWSSDVCSSDLLLDAPGRLLRGGVDRNVAAVTQHIDGPGRLLRGGVDRNICAVPYRPFREGRLLRGGVDRNDTHTLAYTCRNVASCAAAWHETSKIGRATV